MFQISEFHQVFWLIKEENYFFNRHSKFQDHLSKNFFTKWRF